MYKLTHSTIVKLVVLFVAFYLALGRSWVGEDAFIFFKYVDNLISGHGLVFNLGERVEGYTAPLWVFVLAFFRILTGIELRPLAIIIGLFLSLAAIAILLKYDNNNRFIFPVGVLLLISNSAFRDYATSGFETSLTYFLTVIVALLIKKEQLMKHSLLTGFVISLLVLNRPETFLIFLYLGTLYLTLALLKTLQLRKFSLENFMSLLRYLLWPVILLGSYQIFRLGYFGTFFPNTYYAKKGGEVYVQQGLNYLLDFLKSYPITVLIIVILLVLSFIMFFKSRNAIYKFSAARFHLAIIALLLTFYVLRSGGDYMHGRSLLIVLILLAVSVNDVLDRLLSRYFSQNDLGTYFLMAAFFSFIVLLTGILQRPYTVRHEKQINYINDERNHFGVSFTMAEFGEYLRQRITHEFGWRDRGYYYRDIATVVEMPISIVNANIGYFGYAAGEHVNVMGGILIDPYMSRQPIENRGKVGHENDMDWPYILSRKPTFSYTPFKVWNDSAHAKYSGTKYVSAITDDSNDSYVPVFDLSNKDFIRIFSNLTQTNIQKNIDNAQSKLLTELNSNNLEIYDFDIKEYFSFLKIHWYPYTTEGNQAIYDEKRAELYGSEEVLGSYEEFMITRKFEASKAWKSATAPLTLEVVRSNIIQAINTR